VEGCGGDRIATGGWGDEGFEHPAKLGERSCPCKQKTDPLKGFIDFGSLQDLIARTGRNFTGITIGSHG
jgi:hypothetical protein